MPRKHSMPAHTLPDLYRLIGFLLSLAGVGFTPCCVGRAADPAQPNIIFILVDDLAWSDLGCYGNRLHDTPHIDRLAAEGMRFTQAYAPAPICSASRAALLTGKFPAKLHFEFVTKDQPGQQDLPVDLQSPPFTLNLPLNEPTLGEVLTGCGYECGFFGKWHLNQHYQTYLGWSPTHGPLQQGFAFGDSDFGAHPYSYRLQRDLRDTPLAAGAFPQDTLTDKAAEFLVQPRDKPFLLYLSHYFVHDPIHSRNAELVAKYRQRLAGTGASQQAEYAAMVETLDHLIGQLLQTLDESQIADQTLVILMSDNGGHPNYTTNAPLRGSKWNLYEGGIRVPFIVRWPGNVPPHSTCERVIHGCDVLPTLAAIADGEQPLRPLDGTSLTTLLEDPTAEIARARPLVWHFPYYHPEKNFLDAPARIGSGDFVTSQTRPHSAIRDGDWKLIYFYEDERSELYNLASDMAETNDLSQRHVSRTTALYSQLHSRLSQLDARLPVARKRAAPLPSNP